MTDKALVDLSHLNILIVEDDRPSALLTDAILTNCGAQTTVAYSGPDGLAQLYKEHQKLNLIILDFQMPLISGFDFMKVLRSHPNPKLRQICVAAVTTQTRERERVLASGCNLYFSKPIDPLAFLKELDKFQSSLFAALANV